MNLSNYHHALLWRVNMYEWRVHSHLLFCIATLASLVRKMRFQNFAYQMRTTRGEKVSKNKKAFFSWQVKSVLCQTGTTASAADALNPYLMELTTSSSSKHQVLRTDAAVKSSLAIYLICCWSHILDNNLYSLLRNSGEKTASTSISKIIHVYWVSPLS